MIPPEWSSAKPTQNVEDRSVEIGTTVVLADAHAMIREGLKLVLRETGRMRVVGETDCVEEAVRLSCRLAPDILAIDLAMIRGSGLPTIRKLMAREPETNVLVLTDPEHPEPLDGLIAAGIRGCIGKNRPARDLVIAVDLVANGRMLLPRRASRMVQRRVPNHGSGLEAQLARLNEKERDILVLTARGLTAREIAARIGLATKSVYNYRSHILTKLEIRTRAELVGFAMEAGMLERDLGRVSLTGPPDSAPRNGRTAR